MRKWKGAVKGEHTLSADIKRTAAALELARAAGDVYAVGRFTARLERLVGEYRDELLTALEAGYDQVEAAERGGDAVAAGAAFQRFERTLWTYERLCDRIREREDLPDCLAVAGHAASLEKGAIIPGFYIDDKHEAMRRQLISLHDCIRRGQAAAGLKWDKHTPETEVLQAEYLSLQRLYAARLGGRAQ